MKNLGTAIATTAQTCMKCKAAPAVLTLANDTDSAWEYCTLCAQHSLYSTGPDYDGGPGGRVVRYVRPATGLLRSDLPASALALCR